MTSRSPRPRWRRILSFAVWVIGVLAARSSLADHYTVPTGSMEPTVLPGDRIVVNKLAYDLKLPFAGVALAELGEPRPGDVVTLESPEDGRRLLKRVVAGPGMDVEVRAGRIYLDGASAAELVGDLERERLGACVHDLHRTHGGGPDLGPIRVPDGQLLVMGDNRGDSRDGRSFGFVDRSRIEGRAIGVWYRDGLDWHPLACP